MSRKTLIKFWAATAILGALLVSRHAGAQPTDYRNGTANHTTFFRL